MGKMPKQSEKIFAILEGFCDWDDRELNVWSFEQSVCDLFSYYSGKMPDEQLYYACTGLVALIGSIGVRDPVIVYIEFFKSGESDKGRFIDMFKRNKEKYKEIYEDFPDIIDDEFFDYCFQNLLRSGLLIKCAGERLRAKSLEEFDINLLAGRGETYSREFDRYFSRFAAKK